MFDYHVHTTYSRHGSGTMTEYVESALTAGLSQMGFTDHLPWVGEGNVPWCIPGNEFDAYLADVAALKQRYHQIEILLGVEADFVPGLEDQTRALIARASFDYVIGSVHFLGGWNFDDADAQDEWQSRDIDEVYVEYWNTVAASAETGLFSIIGHCDLPKKFGKGPIRPLHDEIRRMAKRLREASVVVEVNTSGLRRPANEIYPSLSLLSILAEERVPVTLGSDAHDPGDVARDFSAAFDLIQRAGYDTVHRWQAPRKFAPVPLQKLRRGSL